MRKSDKARRFAAMAASGLMIIVALTIGSMKNINAMQASALELFVKGTSENGSVASDLAERAETGALMAQLLAKHMDAKDADLAELAGASEALRAASGNIWAQKEADARLRAALDALYLREPSLSSLNDSKADKDRFTAYRARLLSLSQTMEGDPYNTKAAEANRKTDSFPASMFIKLGLCKPLPVFTN